MSAARIDSAGRVVILDGKAAPEEVVTAEDVQDAPRLAKLLARVLSALAALKRPFVPRRLDFEDIPVLASGASVALAHGFSGRVRWWVVGWQCTTNVAPIFREDTTNTTAATLVLLSYVAGTVCVRVEAAG